jgi:hypothetical protein
MLADLADETDAFTDRRPDQSLLSAGVADRATNGVDATVESRLGHDTPAPNRLYQFILADDPIAVPDQKDKQVKNLGFNGNQCGALAKLTAVAVESKVFEKVEQPRACMLKNSVNWFTTLIVVFRSKIKVV